jgi:Tfp pilus assembly protein PilN
MDLATLTTRIRRADFLDGLGIYVEAERVSFAHVSKRLLRVALHRAASYPLAPVAHPEERIQSLTDAVGAFVHGAGVESSVVHLCLPRRELLLNRLVLPAAARENLAQVLEYEVERVIPLPRSEIYFGYQVRASGTGETARLAVLLICVPQRVVRQYVGALEAVGMRPKAIVVSAGALGDFAAFCLGGLEPPTAVLAGLGNESELALFVDGRLVADHALDADAAGDDARIQALCQRDLAEVFHVTEGPVRVLRVPAPDDGAGESLFALAGERLETPPDLGAEPEPQHLPAIGAALGAVRESVVGINLLPEEHRPGLQEGLFVPLILMVAVVVLGILYGGSVIVRDEMVGRSLAREVEVLEPEVADVRAREAEARTLRAQTAILTAEENRRMVQYLRELTTKIPEDAYLTTLRFRNGRIEIDGFASRSSELIQILEGSPMFRSVKFTSPVTAGQGGKERFSIVAEVEE